MDAKIVREKIDTFFNETNLSNMQERVRQFYSVNIVFEDPLVELTGIEALTKYYSNLYRHLIAIKFDIPKVQFDGRDAFALWTMELRHKRLNGGSTVHVPGMSHLTFEGHQATYHRDYFDLSTMVYEQIPLVGPVVRFLKEKGGSSWS